MSAVTGFSFPHSLLLRRVLNSGILAAPTCLCSCKSRRWPPWACRPPAPMAVPRVLLPRVSMIGCKGRVISEHPKEVYGQNLAKHIPSPRHRCPIPSRASFGSESRLPMRDHKGGLVPSFGTALALCKVFQMCPIVQPASHVHGTSWHRAKQAHPSRPQAETLVSRRLVWHKWKRFTRVCFQFKKISSYNFCSHFMSSYCFYFF